MKAYAQINEDSIVVALLQTSGEVDAPHMIEVPNYDNSLLGKLYSGGEFIDPPEPDPVTWDNASPEYWWIEVGSFYDRFGAAKIPVLASPDPTVQALVRDTQVRKYIDLRREDVVQFVDFLGTVVPEVTPEVRQAVLGYTTEEERYIKGLPQPVEAEE